MRQIPGVDLASPAFKANPYPFYAQLREAAPAYRTTVQLPTRKRAWLLTRYDDVMTGAECSDLVPR
jgi:hypothetical protein